MNLRYLAPPILNLIARRLIVPTIVLVGFGAVIIHLTEEIEAENQHKLIEIGSMVWKIDEIDSRIADLAKELNVIRLKDNVMRKFKRAVL